MKHFEPTNKSGSGRFFMRVGHSKYASDINSVSGGKKNKLRGLLILLPFRSNWATQLKTGGQGTLAGQGRRRRKK